LLGLALATTTAVMWGVLPIALTLTLTQLDAWTITWTRFAGSALALGMWLGYRKQLPGSPLRLENVRKWLLTASLGLTANYVLYLIGLSYTSPAVTQTVMQVAPLMLLILGMIFLHERFSGVQWAGAAVLAGGLMVFFNRRLPELLAPSRGWSFGILLLVISSVSWAVYGLSQKQLQSKLGSAQILFLIYCAASLILLPAAHPAAILRLTAAPFIALLFCVVNTVVAYGAFGAALEVWEVSRVSSVVTSAPLFTVLGTMAAERAALSWVVPEHLNGLAMLGAAMVVAGSAVCALGRAR